MISLVLDHNSIDSAIISDGGDFVSAMSVNAPQGGYRDFLLAARDLVTRLDAPASMPVAVAAPAIVDDGYAHFTIGLAMKWSHTSRIRLKPFIMPVAPARSAANPIRKLSLRATHRSEGFKIYSFVTRQFSQMFLLLTLIVLS